MILSTEYIAGFFDGEGTIQIKYRLLRYKGRPDAKYAVFEMLLSVAQVDKTPLRFMQESYGGSIRTDKNGVSSLRFTGENARTFLAVITPHLIVKREEAEVALKFAALCSGHCGRRGVSEAVKVQKLALYHEISRVREAKGFRVMRRVKQQPWSN